MLRIGQGFDAHQLIEGRRLILGGVDIPHERGLLGHSDADVLIHAMIDALLGAAGLGVIGQHFPDTDEQFRNISSLVLLNRVKILMSGWVIHNIDSTIIAQEPKVQSYFPKMKRGIAEYLGITDGQINIKATTTEHLGFTGRKEGIAAMAVVLIEGTSK